MFMLDSQSSILKNELQILTFEEWGINTLKQPCGILQGIKKHILGNTSDLASEYWTNIGNKQEHTEQIGTYWNILTTCFLDTQTGYQGLVQSEC